MTNVDPDPDEVRRLFSGEYHDPHHVLGAHLAGDGVVVRALRPDAQSVLLQLDEEPAPIKMERIHDGGLFQAFLPGLHQVPGYRLRASYGDGGQWEGRDAYAYLPTLGDIDLHLHGEGRHERLYEVLGAHVRRYGDVEGVSFAVWAPNARGVSVVGAFNHWDGRHHPMRMMGGSGVWELFVPALRSGEHYKYEIRGAAGGILIKADPYAQAAEHPPSNASKVFESHHEWKDRAWMDARASRDSWHEPLSIYEVHLGSWKRKLEEGGRRLTYRELAHDLADYVLSLGFTHIELMPVMEYPFDGSWGYQVTGYFAPTSRYGTPDDFKYFVDHMHSKGLGVIMDWVPAHFPKDEWALGRFDGSALYEHVDPRQGEHPDWGTFVFNFGRREVRNFLLASALIWLDQYHLDGLRVDAVASMLYLDYSRKEGEWIPNMYGGRENLDAVQFLQELNATIHRRHPGVLMIAEESTAWTGVSRPTHVGGLGFGFKWNMGWMHDTLVYMTKEPVHRKFHHNEVTFSMIYAYTENFILPFSHDEVVHGKGSMLDKMPGDRWQKFANLRALYGYMWAHPGKKLLFMGCEIGQWREWQADESLDWHVMMGEEHAGLQRLVGDLNRIYRQAPALWEADHEGDGFRWIDAHSADDNVLAFMRTAPRHRRRLVSITNFSPVVRHNYRVGLPELGVYREILNTDAASYSGGNVGNNGAVTADHHSWHGLPYSAALTLPPLATVWLEVP